MGAYHIETLTHAGHNFRVTLHPDDSHGCPWDEEDGHGPVRWMHRDDSLHRGEVMLHDGGPRGCRYAYDWGSAIVTAARDKWGVSDDVRASLTRKLGKTPTRAQIRAEAVRQDIAYLQSYLSGDWCYVGILVTLLDADDYPVDVRSLWGVDSRGEYWRDVARELADGILHERAAVWRAALAERRFERRESRYWASRDVVTVESHTPRSAVH